MAEDQQPSTNDAGSGGRLDLTRAHQIFTELVERSAIHASSPPALVVDPLMKASASPGKSDAKRQWVVIAPRALAESEDYFVALCAHELGHLAKAGINNAATRRWHATGWALWAALAAAVAAAVLNASAPPARSSGILALLLTDLMFVLIFCALAASNVARRPYELAADQFAVSLLNGTSWDPAAFVRQLVATRERRHRARVVRSAESAMEIVWSTHPSPRRRLAAMGAVPRPADPV